MPFAQINSKETEMSTKKKKAALIAGATLAAILLSPLLITCFLIIVLYTPIDLLRYRLSAFRRETGHKYRWLITTSGTYRIYRIIDGESLSIKYYKDKEDDGTTGFFVAGDRLLCYGIARGSLTYDPDISGLTVFCSDKWQRADEFLTGELNRFEKKYGKRPRSAIALYSLSGSDKSDKDGKDSEELYGMAEGSGMFCLYDGRRSLHEVLISFDKEAGANPA